MAKIDFRQHEQHERRGRRVMTGTVAGVLSVTLVATTVVVTSRLPLAAAGAAAPSGAAVGDVGSASTPIRVEPAGWARAGSHGRASTSVVHEDWLHRTQVREGSVSVLSYDRDRGVAQLRDNTIGVGGRSSEPAVHKGDVVASAPTLAEPDGALFTVKSVRRTRSGYRVRTGRATLDQVLGAATVDRTLEGDDLSVSVTTVDDHAHVLEGSSATSEQPLARPASYPGGAVAAAEPAGLPVGTVTMPQSRPGGVLLSLDVPSSLTGMSGSATKPYRMAGWVGLTPKLLFSYSGSGSRPRKATLGIGGTYEYGWLVHATMPVTVGTGVMELEIPFATVHLGSVIWVGMVPVVVTADIGLFYKVSATGDLIVDAEQLTEGEFTLAGQYTKSSGWEPVKSNTSTSVRGGHEAVMGSTGRFRAVFGTEVAVLLYGVVGLAGTVGPYLQATVPVQESALATTPWVLSGGIEIVGALTMRIGLFGLTVWRIDLPLGRLEYDWPITSGSFPA